MNDIIKEPEVDKAFPMLMSAVFDPNKGQSGGIAGYFGVEPRASPSSRVCSPPSPSGSMGRARLCASGRATFPSWSRGSR
jgi:hypothetical protein